ncbi:hypothetical protein MRX96_031791 [Rhipicephalus microplus]
MHQQQYSRPSDLPQGSRIYPKKAQVQRRNPLTRRQMRKEDKYRVTAVDSSTRIGSALEVPQSGKLVALLKFYRTGYSFADAGDSSKIPGLSKTFYSASLSSLYIRPNPLTLVEFRAVTGEINY